MRLRKLDVITFNIDGTEHRGTALRYDPRSGVIVAKVFGRPFRWEGGPPGEYLDRRDNLVQGQIGYSDSLWLVPYTAITGIQGRESVQQAPSPA